MRHAQVLPFPRVGAGTWSYPLHIHLRSWPLPSGDKMSQGQDKGAASSRGVFGAPTCWRDLPPCPSGRTGTRGWREREGGSFDSRQGGRRARVLLHAQAGVN